MFPNNGYQSMAFLLLKYLNDHQMYIPISISLNTEEDAIIVSGANFWLWWVEIPLEVHDGRHLEGQGSFEFKNSCLRILKFSLLKAGVGERETDGTRGVRFTLKNK